MLPPGQSANNLTLSCWKKENKIKSFKIFYHKADWRLHMHEWNSPLYLGAVVGRKWNTLANKCNNVSTCQCRLFLTQFLLLLRSNQRHLYDVLVFTCAVYRMSQKGYCSLTPPSTILNYIFILGLHLLPQLNCAVKRHWFIEKNYIWVVWLYYISKVLICLNC